MKYKVFAAVILLLEVCILGGNALAAQVNSKKADIVFFIDSSGSMQDDINGVRNNLAAFSRAMVANSIDVRFAVVEYQYSRGIVTYRPDGTNIWTSDTAQVEAVLAGIYADDGDGDSLKAINEIFNWNNFRSDTSRFGFMLTDVIIIGDVVAEYDEDNGETYYFDLSLLNENTSSLDELRISEEQGLQVFNSSMAGTIQKLNDMNMHMSVISTSGLEKAYHNLYSSTGGEFMDITGDYANLMMNIANYVEDVVDNDDNTNTKPAPLSYMPLEAIPDDELNQLVTSGDFTETILERIARQAKITSSEINVITESNKHLYGLAAAPEPSQEARQAAGNDTFIAKLNSLTLYSDFQQPGETGYFLAKINVPNEIASMGLTTGNVRMLAVFPEESGQASGMMQLSSLIFRSASTDPLSYWLFKEGLGIETTALQDAGYMLFLGPVADKAILYMLRIILLLLGGCNTGALAGAGTAGFLTAGGVILLRKIFRKH